MAVTGADRRGEGVLCHLLAGPVANSRRTAHWHDSPERDKLQKQPDSIDEISIRRGYNCSRSGLAACCEHTTSPNPSTDETGGAGWLFILRPPFLAGLRRHEAQRRPS